MSYTQILRQGTYAQYLTSTKDANLLFFCTDNGKLFKGEVDFTNSFVSVTSSTLPQAGVPGKIYYETDTNKFKTYIGSAYIDITFPIDTEASAAISSESDENHVPTSKNVYEYGQDILSAAIGGSAVVKSVAAGDDAAELVVTSGDDTPTDVVVPGVLTGVAAGSNAAQIAITNSTAASSGNVTVPGVITAAAAGNSAGQIDFTNSTSASSGSVTVPGVITGLAMASGANTDGVLSITKTTGNAETLTINGVVTTPTWNSTTRTLTLPVNGAQNPVVVDIGKDLVLESGSYDPSTKKLILVLNDEEQTEIEIDVSDLVDEYTAGNTSTVEMSLSNSNEFTANVRIDQHSGNAITVANDTGEGAGKVAGGLRVDLSSYALDADLQALAAAFTWGSFPQPEPDPEP